MRQAVDEAGLQWSAGRCHDDRDRLGGSHGCPDRRREVSHDDIDAASDELLRNLTRAVAAPVGIAQLKCDVDAFRVTERLQTTFEVVGERMRRRRRYQHAYDRQLSLLLCACGVRPHRHTAEQGDDLAPPHVKAILKLSGDSYYQFLDAWSARLLHRNRRPDSKVSLGSIAGVRSPR